MRVDNTQALAFAAMVNGWLEEAPNQQGKELLKLLNEIGDGNILKKVFPVQRDGTRLPTWEVSSAAIEAFNTHAGCPIKRYARA